MATLQFLGAAGTVTGSKYLLEAAGERLMIDCGLFQGPKELRLRNWNPLPVAPASVQWLVLTHAHLDHVGYIPRLVKDGFAAEILATPATGELARLTLPDSGHLQEEDADYANLKKFSKHAPALPLYTEVDAVNSLKKLRAIDETKPVELSPHFSLRFFRAGHILGARSIEVTVRENGSARTVLFSGDLGRYHQLIIREPEAVEGGDHLLDSGPDAARRDKRNLGSARAVNGSQGKRCDHSRRKQIFHMRRSSVVTADARKSVSRTAS